MTYCTKRVARHLAKALIKLDTADFAARDWPEMSNKIRNVRVIVSNLFTATGYEFGAGDGCRIRQRRNA